MLSWSISRTDAAPTPTATARRRMSGARRSRWAIERVLESRTPGIRWQPGCMITAAATTAPHVGATPTSSTPTTRVRPWFQRRRSNRRVGTMTAIGRKGTPTGRRAAQTLVVLDPRRGNGAGYHRRVTRFGPPIAAAAFAILWLAAARQSLLVRPDLALAFV